MSEFKVFLLVVGLGVDGPSGVVGEGGGLLVIGWWVARGSANIIGGPARIVGSEGEVLLCSGG